MFIYNFLNNSPHWCLNMEDNDMLKFSIKHNNAVARSNGHCYHIVQNSDSETHFEAVYNRVFTIDRGYMSTSRVDKAEQVHEGTLTQCIDKCHQHFADLGYKKQPARLTPETSKYAGWLPNEGRFETRQEVVDRIMGRFDREMDRLKGTMHSIVKVIREET